MNLKNFAEEFFGEAFDAVEGLGVEADVGEIEGEDFFVDDFDEFSHFFGFFLSEGEFEELDLVVEGFDEFEVAGVDAVVGFEVAGIFDEEFVEN